MNIIIIIHVQKRDSKLLGVHGPSTVFFSVSSLTCSAHFQSSIGKLAQRCCLLKPENCRHIGDAVMACIGKSKDLQVRTYACFEVLYQGSPQEFFKGYWHWRIRHGLLQAIGGGWGRGICPLPPMAETFSFVCQKK